MNQNLTELDHISLFKKFVGRDPENGEYKKFQDFLFQYVNERQQSVEIQHEFDVNCQSTLEVINDDENSLKITEPPQYKTNPIKIEEIYEAYGKEANNNVSMERKDNIETIVKKLSGHGYKKIKNYFKRTNQDLSEYVFINGIDDKVVGNKNLKGTYYLKMPSGAAEKFEKLITKVNNCNGYKLLSTVLLTSTVTYFALPLFIPSLMLSPISLGFFGAACAPPGILAYVNYSESKTNKAIKQVKENYLSDVKRSNSPFDYNLIKQAL